MARHGTLGKPFTRDELTHLPRETGMIAAGTPASPAVRAASGMARSTLRQDVAPGESLRIAGAFPWATAGRPTTRARWPEGSFWFRERIRLPFP
ncbi:hypothetical protein [Sediminicoccus rosea]|uniref:Uncharacterized protein n=1 Tax=Sediminicoccus rosea TaxID=1225128 RepID=A0ABZ0PQ29_9PROT|nr:hypothetical protein [Sediminicoccus rosea]WPB87635.1 hypothetical protein R9Z33_12305 [Sediminicoccus rosea]